VAEVSVFLFSALEFAKLGLVVFLAYLLDKKEEKIRSSLLDFFPRYSSPSRHRPGDERTRFGAAFFSR